MRWQLTLLLLALLACASSVSKINFVFDAGPFLTIAQRDSLNDLFGAFDKTDNVQIVAYLEDDLEGRNAFNYSLQIADSLGVGHKYVNSGLLIFIAPNDRVVHIQVGHGLENQITDSTAQAMVDSMMPYFKKADYFGAISNTAEQVMELTKPYSWRIQHDSYKAFKAAGSPKNEIVQLEGHSYINLGAAPEPSFGPYLTMDFATSSGDTIIIERTRYMNGLLKDAGRSGNEYYVIARSKRSSPPIFQLMGIKEY